MKDGVYKITNIKNNKVYIGESENVKRRWEQHIRDLDNNTHCNYKLQRDWNKYGKENFTFYHFEETEYQKTIEKRMKRKIFCLYLEDKLIKEYDAINNGYNIERTKDKILNGEKSIYNKKGMIDGVVIHLFNMLYENSGEFKVPIKIRTFDKIKILLNKQFEDRLKNETNDKKVNIHLWFLHLDRKTCKEIFKAEDFYLTKSQIRYLIDNIEESNKNKILDKRYYHKDKNKRKSIN